MAVTKRGDKRKGIRRQSGRRKDDIEKIIPENDKELEVTVHHEAIPPKKATSVWSWHEEFIAEWSDSLISKKRKRIHKNEKETREK